MQRSRRQKIYKKNHHPSNLEDAVIVEAAILLAVLL